LARKILLADDSVTAQNMGRKILADAGYDVVTVNNGSAALKRVAEIKPDLIVLDVYMPGYSGLEVCQRLKDAAETLHIPILLTVGKLEPFKADEARRVKADGHIVKPFEASELLTAITRLEDCLSPQRAAGLDRFAGKPISRSESHNESDSGWTSRLSFSKKKKEEPEEEAAGAAFRDFRKTRGQTQGKAAPTSSVTVKPPAPAGQEPGLVPDIPRDITPAELDALSALASQLNTPPAAEVSAQPEFKNVEPAPEAQATSVSVPDFVVESASHTEVQSESAPRASENFPVISEAAAAESQQSETHYPEIPPAEFHSPEPSLASVVCAALLAQEAAPIDREDEPSFASVPSAIVEQQVVEDQRVEHQVEQPVNECHQSHADFPVAESPAEAIAANVSDGDLAAAPVSAEAVTASTEELKPEISEAVAEDLGLPETDPSDAELVEALRLLTPSSAYSDAPTTPTNGALAAAGQLLVEAAARDAAAQPRWVAEPAMLSPEEAASSLEAEMFLTLAATANKPDMVSDPERIVGVSAIAAAVENRLAEGSANSRSFAEEAANNSAPQIVAEHQSESHARGEAATFADAMASNELEGHQHSMDGAAQPVQATELALKAMAAAAAESSGPTDASTIASIVESVMADLRPRIVEEIAKKLSGK
jgi:CheY-like chemotaxis protein